MKQMYYTSCAPGRSVSGQSGFQVRAESAGITPEKRSSMLEVAGYKLPPDFSETTPPAQSPRRLALLNSAGGRILVASQYADPDPATGRNGNFFSHLLVDLPTDLSAADAAGLIHAAVWVLADRDGPVALPELQAFPKNSGLTDAELRGFAGEHHELLQFLLVGLLSIKDFERLFVVAHPDDVAYAVVIIGRMLPTAMGKALTFSTFEREPLACTGKIVGTFWRDANLDLEPMCYGGAGLAFHTLSGKQSPLPPATPFAAFVLRSWQQGKESEVQQFYRQCGSLPLNSASELELAYRMIGGESAISVPDFVQALAFPDLAAAVAARPKFAEQVVQWALTDNEFRDQHWLKVVKIIQPISKLTGALAQRAAAAFQANDRATASRVFDDLAACLPREAQPELHDGLARSLASVQLPPEAQFHALPYLLKASPTNQSTVDRWLAVPPVDLPKLLSGNFPEEIKSRACELALERSLSQPDASVTAIAAADGKRVLQILQRHGLEKQWQTACSALIASVLQCSALKPAAGGLLQRGVNFVRDLACGSFAPATAKDFMRDLARLQRDEALIPALFEEGLQELFNLAEFQPHLFLAANERQWLEDAPPKRKAQAVFANRLLDSTPLNLQSQPVREYLLGLSAQASGILMPAQTARVKRLNDLSLFLQSPTLPKDGFERIAPGLAELTDAGEQTACRRAVLEKSAKYLAAEQRPAESLSALLSNLSDSIDAPQPSSRSIWPWHWQGKRATTSWVQLYSELVPLLAGIPQAARNPALVKAVVAIGFGGTPVTEFHLNKVSNKSDRHALTSAADDFVRSLPLNVAPDDLAQLNHEIRSDWGRKAPAAWALFRAAQKPQARRNWLDYLIYTLLVLIVCVAVGKYLLPQLLAGIISGNETLPKKDGTGKVIDATPRVQFSNPIERKPAQQGSPPPWRTKKPTTPNGGKQTQPLHGDNEATTPQSANAASPGSLSNPPPSGIAE